ncbi:hypothetical protein JCM8202_002296 [Rhodotorula sphaerocarpa]
MVLGRRIRLLVVLAVVVLLPVLSLAYTYRTYRPAAVRARRVAEVVVSGGGGSRAAAGEQAQAQAISATASAASAAPPPDDDSPAQLRIMAAKTAVENALSQRKNRSVVFSKSYCPYCRRAKQLLDSLDEKYDVYELDQMDEGSDWQAYLGDKTGQRTVPSIFIDGEFIGGCSELEGKHRSGELKKLLSK